jgi:hypothetical protein
LGYLLQNTGSGTFSVYAAGPTVLASGTYSPANAATAKDVKSVSVQWTADNSCVMQWNVSGSNEFTSATTPTATKQIKATGSFGMTLSGSQDACYNSFSATVRTCLNQGFTGFYTTFGDVAIIRNGDATACPSGSAPSLAGSVDGGSNTVNLIGSDGNQYLATFTDTSAVVYVNTGNAAANGASVCGVKFDRAAPSVVASSGSLDLISSTGCTDNVKFDPCVQNYLYAADAQRNVAFASADTNPDHKCNSYVGVPVSGSTTALTLYLLKNLVNNDKTSGQLTATYSNDMVVVTNGQCVLTYARAITQTSTTGAYAGTGKITYSSGADSISDTVLKKCVQGGYNGVWDNAGHITLTSVLDDSDASCSSITGTIVGTSTQGSIYFTDNVGDSVATYTASTITLTSLSGVTVTVVFTYTHDNQLNSIGSVAQTQSSKTALQVLAKSSKVFTGTVTKSAGCGKNACFDTKMIVSRSSNGSYVVNSSYGLVAFSCKAIQVPANANKSRTTSPKSYLATTSTNNGVVSIALTQDTSVQNSNAPTCTYTITLGTFEPSTVVNGFKLFVSPANASMQASMVVVALAALMASIAMMML